MVCETQLDGQPRAALRHHTMLYEGGWQLVRGEHRAWVAISPLPGVEHRARPPLHRVGDERGAPRDGTGRVTSPSGSESGEVTRRIRPVTRCMRLLSATHDRD